MFFYILGAKIEKNNYFCNPITKHLHIIILKMVKLSTVQWGFIGCGEVTEKKSGPAFPLVEHSKVVAVMSRDLNKAESYAKRNGIDKYYSDAQALIEDPDGMLSVSYWQLQKPYFGILLGILTGLVGLALASFKSLILQMRLSTLGAIVALGMRGWLAWMYFSWEGPVFSWTVIFPLVISICNILAARSCFQDQLMVESAMRIRERRRRSKKK